MCFTMPYFITKSIEVQMQNKPLIICMWLNL